MQSSTKKKESETAPVPTVRGPTRTPSYKAYMHTCKGPSSDSYSLPVSLISLSSHESLSLDSVSHVLCHAVPEPSDSSNPSFPSSSGLPELRLVKSSVGGTSHCGLFNENSARLQFQNTADRTNSSLAVLWLDWCRNPST